MTHNGKPHGGKPRNGRPHGRRPDDRNQEALERVLVVVDPEQTVPAASGQPGVLLRALELARATGCTLELFHAVHDASLDLRLFSGREEISREKAAVANRAATRLAELAVKLGGDEIEIAHEVRWDHPQPDAILRKIADSEPDLVLKESRGPNFVIGLSDHTDWELIRKSPAHLWFVKRGNESIETVLTAVGGGDAAGRIVSDADYEVFGFAAALARRLGAQNLPVHTYQVPRLYAYSTYAPALAAAGHLPDQVKVWEDIAREHGDAVLAFAGHFDIDPEKIRLSRGHPAEVLPELARSLDAGLVVMGARNLGRWERLFTSVAAEPVLSEAPCDVLFVKEHAGEPTAEAQPGRGRSDVDIEMAITHPEKAFRTPLAVAEAEQLSRDLRRRILDAWEQDLRTAQRDDRAGEAPAGVLQEIRRARQALGQSADRAG